MSLYYEAANFLDSSKNLSKDKLDSLLESTPSPSVLKARVYNSSPNLKAQKAHIHALLAETIKWRSVLPGVVRRSGVLDAEKKLTPALSLLLTHDLLLSKNGVAAPKDHVLRKAISRHKARLSAELTRARVKAGFPTLDSWQAHLNSASTQPGDTASAFHHPRWIRVNTLLTTLPAELRTTFSAFTTTPRITDLTRPSSPSTTLLHLPAHIPSILALPAASHAASTWLTRHEAYTSGRLILQDVSSCLPALLLDPQPGRGAVLDACAAPGNKTTHLAALLADAGGDAARGEKVVACERDPARWTTLVQMVRRAGAEEWVDVLPRGADFLALDWSEAAFASVGAVLVDPSCSGSGIVGREAEGEGEVGERRLRALAALQTRMVLHAMAAPACTRVVYSTCSVHEVENEGVARRALASEVARRRGWRVLRRAEQVEGLRRWEVRGVHGEVREMNGDDDEEEVFRQACVRCEKGTEMGTMGFFVVGFVRDGDGGSGDGGKEDEEQDGWEGVSSPSAASTSSHSSDDDR